LPGLGEVNIRMCDSSNRISLLFTKQYLMAVSCFPR
jgi:hypothetical protein